MHDLTNTLIKNLNVVREDYCDYFHHISFTLQIFTWSFVVLFLIVGFVLACNKKRTLRLWGYFTIVVSLFLPIFSDIGITVLQAKTFDPISKLESKMKDTKDFINRYPIVYESSKDKDIVFLTQKQKNDLNENKSISVSGETNPVVKLKSDKKTNYLVFVKAEKDNKTIKINNKDKSNKTKNVLKGYVESVQLEKK